MAAESESEKLTGDTSIDIHSPGSTNERADLPLILKVTESQLTNKHIIVKQKHCNFLKFRDIKQGSLPEGT